MLTVVRIKKYDEPKASWIMLWPADSSVRFGTVSVGENQALDHEEYLAKREFYGKFIQGVQVGQSYLQDGNVYGPIWVTKK